MSQPEGFVLLTLPNCTISTGKGSCNGVLQLHCVTIDHSVILVLHLGPFESPIDPTQHIQLLSAPFVTIRTYSIATAADGRVNLTVAPPSEDEDLEYFKEDIETFEGLLAQYAEFRTDSYPSDSKSAEASSYLAAPPAHPTRSATVSEAFPSRPSSIASYLPPPVHQPNAPTTHFTAPPPIQSQELSDYKGHLVFVNEDDGRVIGEFDDKLKVREDPLLLQRGHENDPVLIEVNADGSGGEPGSAREVFIRAIPPEQQGWMTKGATAASYVITFGANAIATTISTAASYYIKHSKPSPHHTGASTPALSRAGSSSSVVGARDGKEAPPQVPPKPPMLVSMLTSAQTHKNMQRLHTVSGQAVKVSTKTLAVVDDLVKRVAGRKPKPASPQPQYAYPTSPVSSTGPPPPFPPRSRSPLPTKAPSPAPPPYLERSQTAPPPLPPRTKLSFPKRLILSADVIWSTLDESGKMLIDVGGRELTNVMTHKYGKEAGESTSMLTGSAKNVALVYVDMKGMGRRALLKRVGKEYVKGKMGK